MKKALALLIATVILVGSLTACAGVAYDRTGRTRGYSNVSTTENGRVNGVNPDYGTIAPGYNGRLNDTQNGVVPRVNGSVGTGMNNPGT